MMNFRWRAWQMLLLLGVMCAGILYLIVHFRFGPTPDTRQLLAMLPTSGASIVHIDVKALRSAGVLDVLAGNRMLEEADYRAFVEATGFDYRNDLDVVVGAFRSQTAYLVLVGRFDGASLKKYALSQGGRCLNGVCDIPGSQKDRWISFRPLKSNVLAVASADSVQAAADVGARNQGGFEEVPTQPIWVSFPASALASDASPAGTRLFARALAGALDVTFAVDRVAGGGFEATMVANCQGAVEATELVNQLSGVTAVLKNYLARLDKQPNPADLSGVLTAGTFERRERRVYGRWPVPQAFLQSLAGGNL